MAYGNALTGMAGPQRLMTNSLQPPQPAYKPTPGGGIQQQIPYQQHPMPYQPQNSIPYLPPQVPWSGQQHIPNPMPQGPQWPNPHAGAYQEWMQKFAGQGQRQQQVNQSWRY